MWECGNCGCKGITEGVPFCPQCFAPRPEEEPAEEFIPEEQHEQEEQPLEEEKPDGDSQS